MLTKYDGLSNFVKTSLAKNLKIEIMFQEAKSKFKYEGSFNNFKDYCRKYKKIKIKKIINKVDISENFFSIIKDKKQINLIDICNDLNCSPKKIQKIIFDLRNKGYEILCHNNIVYYNINNPVLSPKFELKPIGEREIIFGVASDLHFGSQACQITALNEFCEICRKRGVEYIFSPGDLVAGHNVYKGQEFDLYAIEADNQEDSLITNLPKGFKWLVMGGNHDYSFISKGGGHNPLLSISSKRNDIIYLGYDEAIVPIFKDVDLKMWHPCGGVPYAMSYKLQRGIEQVAYEELNNVSNMKKDKPSIRFILAGHLHIQMQAMFGPIFGCQCGSFEGKTNYLKRHGLVPNVGGYIIRASLGTDSLLKNFDAKFYLFDEIENDFQNFKHSIPKNLKINPIFEK